MAPQARWIHSFATDDKIYCLYLADNSDTIREHARRGDFPQTTSRSSER
jgi:Nickel responsive protein SCO4226-like